MRVLHVIANVAPRYGGPAQAVQEMCRTLASRGHRVELFTTNEDGQDVLQVPVGSPVSTDGYVTTYFGYKGLESYPVSMGLYHALQRRIRDFEIVDIHGVFQFHTLVGPAIARKRQVPYIIRPHGALDRYQRARHRGRKAIYLALVERGNLNAAAAIHYISDQERLEGEETGIRAPGFVVPLGLDVEAYRRPTRDVSIPVGIPRDIPLVTFIGRLAEVKGLDLTINAFSRVIDRGGKAHLVLAGPDNYDLRKGLERQVIALGLEGHVTFTGAVEGVSKLALLQRSRAFVLTSHHENFGIAVVEALAAGVPVIISRGVAIHPDVDLAHAGIVVDRTSEAVADAILLLLSGDTARQQMAVAARDLAVRRFSLDAMGEGLERIYDHAIYGRAVPTSRGT